jgi:hypothetical protein
VGLPLRLDPSGVVSRGAGLKGRESFFRSRLLSFQLSFSRPFRPQDCGDLLTQGIGLRPQPWAGLCRPVGPEATSTL